MTTQPAVAWGPVQLNAIATQLTPVISAGRFMISRAVFTNLDGNTRTFTVYCARSGTSLSNANTIISLQALLPQQSAVPPELANLVLGPGDSVWALADQANFITTVGSGFVVT